MSDKKKNERNWIVVIEALAVIVGFLAFFYGLYSIYPPIAYIAGGGFLIYIGTEGAFEQPKGGD